MNVKIRIGRMLMACVVLAALSCGLALSHTQKAHAYTYLNSNTTSVFNRAFITVNTSGYLELIGCDPHDTSPFRPCWEDASVNCSTYIVDYLWAVWGVENGQDDIQWHSAWRGSWERNGYTFGTGYGETNRYGYGFGGNVVALHGGFDQMMYAHTYIKQAAYLQAPVLYEHGETSFWPRVTIQYNANGGAGEPSAHFKYIGNGTSIPSTEPTRTGYTFEGWSTKKAGPVNIAAGQYIGLEDWNLAEPVYIAHGWSDGPANFWSDSCGGTPSPSGTNVITLYAQWKPITYVVAYDGNGATSGATASSSHVYDAARALTTNGFKRAYTLTCDAQGGSNGIGELPCSWAWTGWNTNADGAGTSYADKANVRNLRSMTDTVTLYAQWSPGYIALPDPGTKENCIFKGWFTAANGGSLIGQAGTSVSIAADTTYYAQWEEYAAIGYYVDGERDPVFSERVVAGSSYAVNPQAVDQGSKNSCAEFDGWYVDSAYTQRYVDGSVVSSKGLKLYGRNKVDVTYEPTEQSHSLLAEHELFADEALGEPFSLEQALPQAESFYYGDRITFARGQSVWFEAHERPREASCEVGAYLSADATGALVRTMRLTSNTTVYLMWGVPAYDGIALS